MFTAIAFMFQVSTAEVVLPYPFLEYCVKSHADCHVDKITTTDLAFVNKEISEGFIPTVPDNESYYDHWVSFPPDRKGDCDDEVVTKRDALIALGFDPRKLTVELGTAIYPSGKRVNHAILWAEIDGKRWALDSIVPDMIYTELDRPYKWEGIAKQSHEHLLWDMEVRK